MEVVEFADFLMKNKYYLTDYFRIKLNGTLASLFPTLDGDVFATSLTFNTKVVRIVEFTDKSIKIELADSIEKMLSDDHEKRMSEAFENYKPKPDNTVYDKIYDLTIERAEAVFTNVMTGEITKEVIKDAKIIRC